MAVVMACVWGSTGHFLVKGNMTNANIRGDHTIMARVKWTTTTTTAHYYPVCLINDTDFGGTMVARISGDPSTTVRGGRKNAAGSTLNTVSDTGVFGNTTTWYHFAVVYNASTQIAEFYVDGVSQGTVSSLTTLVTADTAGAFGILGTCKVADAAVYNRALSASEVLQMASYRVQSVTSNCLGFYRMDTNSSGGTAEGNATDTSGNGNTLTADTSAGGTGFTYSTADNPPQPENPVLAGGPTSASTLSGSLNTNKPVASTATSASTLSGAIAQTQALAGTQSSASTFTSALSASKPVAGDLTSAGTLAGELIQSEALAGTQASASTLAAWSRPRWGRRIVDNGTTNLTGAGLSVSTGAFTWMAWLRALSLPASGNTVYAQMLGTSFNARLGITNSAGTQSWSLRVFDGTSTTFVYTAAVDSAWHHAALSYDGADVRAYVDGSLVATVAVTFAGPTATSVNITTSNTISGCYGELAHVKLWSAALSAAQIASESTYYTPHVANPQLVGWWQLGWQNVALDSSGNGFALTNNDSNEAQTESPGSDPPPLNALAGTPSSASTITGAITQLHALEAGLDSASTFSALLGQTQPIAGDTSSASVLAALLGQAQPVAGDLTSSDTLTGAVVQVQAQAGDLTSASTLAGAIVQDYPLAGVAASASTLTGTVNANLPLASTATSASTLAGAITQTQTLEGTAASASTLVPAAIGIDGLYAGTSTSASTLDGALNTLKLISADGLSASTLAATISNAQPLAGGLSSASTLSGDGQLPIDLVSTLQDASTLSAALYVNVACEGTAFSASTFAGGMYQFEPLDGDAASASTLTAAITAVSSGGTLTSASTLTATMIAAGPRPVDGTTTSASSLSGTLTGGGGGGGAGGTNRALRRMAALMMARRPVR